MEDKLICYDCGCACDLAHIKKERVENYEGLLQLRPHRKPLAPPPPDGPAFPYRAAFSKTGRMKFLSHLDLQRTMARAFRRAGVSLRYTQGFNPRPIMSFSPALAVGIESREEYVDVTAGAPLQQSVISRLNDVLPEGLVFMRLVPLAPQAPNLASAIAGATYSARVPALARDEARRSVLEFNEAPERFIDKTRKERSVSLDLKRLVGVVTVEESADDSAAVILRFPVAFGPDGSVRPDEVLRGILGRPVDGVSFVRERLHFDAAPRTDRDAAPLADRGAAVV